MDTRRFVRLCVMAVVVLSMTTIGYGYMTAGTTAAAGAGEQADGAATNQQAVEPRDNITVVATDSNTWLGEKSDGPRANAELIAFAPNGSVLYYNDSHTRYWDVDPVPETQATVEYVYAQHLNESQCGGETVCTRNGVERVNLTTGAVEQVYSGITPGKHSTRWHDVDRLDEDSLVVADIAEDRVYAVNTTTNLIEWEWEARSDFTPDSGGPFPEDWTHLNDVEVLDDGRIMVSLRNHDQVVFLDRETGLQENWTLGSDDDHSVLYEQHNPDYMPEANGGPAVLVADSERNRIVEYTRDGDSWSKNWQWSDDRLQWPRDADRLPNGHTLITDSNGNRVFEIDENGEKVWSADIAFPYEAERLGTGDESTGGSPMDSNESGNASAGTGGGENAATGGDSESSSGLVGPQLNAVMYVLPVWMGIPHLLALVALCLTLVGWVALEWRWSKYGVAFHAPVSLRSKR
ncbi:arylsulfotransferase family protein [Halogranum rubrum]|nr:arylsulfotransferase family protein [Halogranum salarium]